MPFVPAWCSPSPCMCFFPIPACSLLAAIPHEFTKRLHDLDVVQNRTATYWAIVKPLYAPVTWYKDGEEVEENRRFHILEDDEGGRYLEIEHALRSDMGTIMVKSRDDECEAQLNVAGKRGVT